MHTTPPFLAWALEQSCALRQIDRWTEPERTERHLRGIVEFSRGLNDGRVVEDVCLGTEVWDETQTSLTQTGFPVAEVLRLFGGEQVVRQACEDCVANVGRAAQQQALASCHGLLPLSHLNQWTTAARQIWFTACAKSPWTATNVDWLALFSLIAGQTFAPDERNSLTHFLAAMECCQAKGLPMHVQMYPAGTIASRRWTLPKHCVACRAPWDAGSGECIYCHSPQATSGELRRHVRGRRPFVPLIRFLSEEEAERLIAIVKQRKEAQKNAARERYKHEKDANG